MHRPTLVLPVMSTRYLTSGAAAVSELAAARTRDDAPRRRRWRHVTAWEVRAFPARVTGAAAVTAAREHKRETPLVAIAIAA